MFWRNTGQKLLQNLLVYRETKEKRDFYNKIKCTITKIKHVFWNLITASDIHRDALIPPTTRLPHPTGIVIHEKSVIGESCMIMQQVTIGTIKGGAPKIGSAVYIGAGAKILGNIVIGDNVRIGANAVVINDVPDNFTAVGVPAKIIIRK